MFRCAAYTFDFHLMALVERGVFGFHVTLGDFRHLASLDLCYDH